METKDCKTKWWNYSTNEISKIQETNIANGLSNSEADQRLKKFGNNQLPEKKRISPIKIFIRQFSNFIVWVLLVAAIIAAFLGEIIDFSVISIFVVLNAALGFFQEYKAEKSIAALRKLSSPTTKVIRDGKMQVVKSAKVVPGDIVFLEAGDQVPADGRVIESTQLSTQEAALTGESLPISKTTDTLEKRDLPIGDRQNMVFQGTIVVNGKGKIVITETGVNTELGKIALLLQSSPDDQTPLQKRLEQLGHHLVAICFGIVLIVFILGLFRGYAFTEMLMMALSLAVAAIPGGLPAVVTVALSIGVRKMAKRNALVRQLPSIETLGCTTVICTDKTGTLTQNEMTVTNIWVNEKLINVKGTGYTPEGSFEREGNIINPKDNAELIHALRIGLLCNNASLYKEDNLWKVAGDPTEGALITVAEKAGLQKKTLEEENPPIQEIPFDSERKKMSVLRKTPKGKILFVKGAPDVLLNSSESILINGNILTLDEKYRELVSKTNKHLASQALRVLAVAYREIDTQETIDKSYEEKLVFVGLIAMMDPPRPEVKGAIDTCKKAGINTVMITGDHKETANAIALQLGLAEKESLSLSGDEVEKMSDADLKDIVKNTKVYARVSAEHKLRIIRAWRELGEVVAMTGDGVNDAPALKEADIGLAMGITGTDVAKEASDIVITDDNFASIVNAVEEGRGIYDNIKKFVSYLLSTNIAELLVIFSGILFGFTDPTGAPFVSLTAVQLLWINLVTDGFPAVALAMDPVDPRAMTMSPRKSSEPILSRKFAMRLFAISVLITCATIAACHSSLSSGAELAHTMAFTTMIILELVRVQMIRSQYHIGIFSNPWLIVAVCGSILVQIAVIYTPILQKIFKTVPLGLNQWLIIFTIVSVTWVVGTLVNKLFQKYQTN